MLTFIFKINEVTKITIDNSQKYIPKSEQNQERDIKPKMIETKLLSRKQNKIIPQNNENFVKNTVAEGFKKFK